MRHLGLLIVTLGICFGIGFSFGAFPRFWDHVLGRPEKNVLLLVSDQQALPGTLQKLFADETGYTLEIQEVKTPNLFLSDAKNANLLYAPWEWLEPSKAQLHPWSDRFWSELYADFQSRDIFMQKFFPLFWQFSSNEGKVQFHFEGFATFQEPNEGTKYLLGFLMEHQDLMKAWTLKRQMSSTLQKAAAWTDLPENLKPQAVRSQPLIVTLPKAEASAVMEKKPTAKKSKK